MTFDPSSLIFYPTDRMNVEQDPTHDNIVVMDTYTLSDKTGSRLENVHSWAANVGFLQGCSFRARGHIKEAPKTKALLDAIKLWPENQVKWESPALKASLENICKRDEFLQGKAMFQAAWREGKAVNTNAILDTTLPLKEYQKVGAILGSRIQEKSGFAFFMEQRTGKTPTTIAAIVDLVLKKKCSRVLVIVPPILKLNWKEEIERFSPIPAVADIITGLKQERIVKLATLFARAAATGALWKAAIVPYDTFVSSQEQFTSMNWDIVVCDESHWFKDHRTSRWKALIKLRDKCRYRFILTGTPMGNAPTDLWTQLEFLEDGCTETVSFKDFKDKCVTTVTRDKIEMITAIKDIKFLKPILAKRAFIVKRADVMKQLPQKIYEYNSVEFGSDEQARHYKDLAVYLCTKIKQDMDAAANNMATINHVLTQLLRLAQITSGYLVKDPDEDGNGREIIYYKNNQKLDQLIEIAKSTEPHQKMIIWNHWIPMIDRIYERFCDEGLGDQIIVYRGGSSYQHERYKKTGGPTSETAKNEFNGNRQYRFLLASAQSANIGLTLPGHPIGNPSFGTICDTEVYFSYNWSYLQRAQSEDRPYETNSTHQVKIIDLLIESTIDQEILEAVRNKKETAESLTNIKEVLQKMFKGEF